MSEQEPKRKKTLVELLDEWKHNPVTFEEAKKALQEIGHDTSGWEWMIWDHLPKQNQDEKWNLPGIPMTPEEAKRALEEIQIAREEWD